MNYSVEAGSVKARVPVVIFRNKLAERTTYYLRLEIVENVPIEITPNQYNERYLHTKKDRMGHTLHFNK